MKQNGVNNGVIDEMATKASKRKSKRGRHTKHSCPGRRTPSGRLSRSKSAKDERQDFTQAQIQELEREAVSVVKAQRMALFGCNEEEAGSNLLGSFIGRLRKSGEISAAQFEAAEKYHRVRKVEKQAYDIRQQRSGSDLTFNGGFDGRTGGEPDYVEWDNKARSQGADARRALLDAGPLSHTACEGIIMEDKEMVSSIGDLRLGLNSLAKLWAINLR